MESIIQAIARIIVRGVLFDTFGYYTILLYYRLTRNEKGVSWLKTKSKDFASETGKNVVVGIVGMLSLIAVSLLLFWLFDYFG